MLLLILIPSYATSPMNIPAPFDAFPTFSGCPKLHVLHFAENKRTQGNYTILKMNYTILKMNFKITSTTEKQKVKGRSPYKLCYFPLYLFSCKSTRCIGNCCRKGTWGACCLLGNWRRAAQHTLKHLNLNPAFHLLLLFYNLLCWFFSSQSI